MNRSSLAGLVVWVALLAIAPWYHGITTVERFFLFAPLVIVPLGFSLLMQESDASSKRTALTRAVQLQPAAALTVISSFLPEPGLTAALLTLPWMAVCILAALSGLAGLRRGGWGFRTGVRAFASIYLLAGSAWLLLSRAGIQPLGFQEPIVLLTAVHFHYSGFAAVLLTGKLADRCERHLYLQVPTRVFCIGTILAMALIAAGFVVSFALKIVAIFSLAICLAGAALVTVWLTPQMRPVAARTRLRISSGASLAGVALAILYALGESTSMPAINLNEMAIFHGALNALGYTFCGMWGWNLIAAKEAT